LFGALALLVSSRMLKLIAILCMAAWVMVVLAVLSRRAEQREAAVAAGLESHPTTVDRAAGLETCPTVMEDRAAGLETRPTGVGDRAADGESGPTTIDRPE
jgi:hypothetical protein